MKMLTFLTDFVNLFTVFTRKNGFIMCENLAKRCIKIRPNAASKYSQTLHQNTAKRCKRLSKIWYFQ